MRYTLLIFIALMLSSVILSAQSEEKDVDSLIRYADTLRGIKHKYDEALITIEKAIQISKEINYPKGLGDAWMRKGRIFKAMDKREEAEKSYYEALRIRESLKDSCGVASIFNNLNSVAGTPEEALEYSKQALEMARRARCDKYLPNFFSTLANGYEELGKMDSAMDANRKGIEIAKQTGNIEGLIISAYGLAKRYHITEKSDTALSLLDSIMVWFPLQSEPDSQKLGQAYELKGVIYLRRAENSSAEYYLSLAHSIYQQFPENKYAIANIYFNIGELELKKGNLKKASNFYEKGAKLVSEWTDLNKLFKSKVDLAKNMREKDWIFFALLFVSFTVAILSFLLYRKEKQLSFERLEKEKLKHDIVKNELMIICNKIALSNHAEPTVKEIKIRIERLLSRLGYQTQDNSLNLRIFAEEMLSEGEVAAKMEIEPNLEYLEEYKLSPVLRDELDCIIKEAFINIGKHARATKIYFEVSVNDEGLNILIKDDGVGFDYHKTPKTGLKNLQSRIEEINGILDIVSKPGEGTHIHIIIPQFPEE